jgi:transcriptional regulator with XRE-family HTH domain
VYRGKPFTTVPGLRRVRTERGYSRRQLAALVGVNESQVWRIENGERTTLDTLGRLAAELRVDSLTELLLDEEDREDTEEVERGELLVT